MDKYIVDFTYINNFEKDKIYKIKFLPNINDLQNPILRFPFDFSVYSYKWLTKMISYALVNGNIKIVILHDKKLNITDTFIDNQVTYKIIYNGHSIVWEQCDDKSKIDHKWILEQYDKIKHIKLENILLKRMYDIRNNVVDIYSKSREQLKLIDYYKSSPRLKQYIKYFPLIERGEKIKKIYQK